MSPAAGGNFPAQATAYNGPYAPTKPLCAEPTGTTVSCQREAVSISAGGRSLSPGGRSGWDPGAPLLQSSLRLGPALAAATYCAAGLNGSPQAHAGPLRGEPPGTPPPLPPLRIPAECQQWETRGEREGYQASSVVRTRLTRSCAFPVPKLVDSGEGKE